MKNETEIRMSFAEWWQIKQKQNCTDINKSLKKFQHLGIVVSKTKIKVQKGIGSI